MESEKDELVDRLKDRLHTELDEWKREALRVSAEVASKMGLALVVLVGVVCPAFIMLLMSGHPGIVVRALGVAVLFGLLSLIFYVIAQKAQTRLDWLQAQIDYQKVTEFECERYLRERGRRDVGPYREDVMPEPVET